MIAFDNLSVTLGQLVSYGLGAAFTDVPHGWRYMVAVGGVPPIILAALLPRCPESPRQLIAHGKRDEAEKCLRQVYPDATEEQMKAKVDRLVWTIEVESQIVSNKSLWWQFKQLHCVPSNLRALISACTVMASEFLVYCVYEITIANRVQFLNSVVSTLSCTTPRPCSLSLVSTSPPLSPSLSALPTFCSRLSTWSLSTRLAVVSSCL